MSKSLNNFFTINEVIERIDPMVLRFYYLNHNYTIPLDFSFEGLEAFAKSYKKLIRIFTDVTTVPIDINTIEHEPIAHHMLENLCDDINIAGLFGIVFENAEQLRTDSKESQQAKALLHNALGLSLAPLAEEITEITPEIQKLIDERQAARAAKDWKRADELRDQLTQLGVKVQDKK